MTMKNYSFMRLLASMCHSFILMSLYICISEIGLERDNKRWPQSKPAHRIFGSAHKLRISFTYLEGCKNKRIRHKLHVTYKAQNERCYVNTGHTPIIISI